MYFFSQRLSNRCLKPMISLDMWSRFWFHRVSIQSSCNRYNLEYRIPEWALIIPSCWDLSMDSSSIVTREVERYFEMKGISYFKNHSNNNLWGILALISLFHHYHFWMWSNTLVDLFFLKVEKIFVPTSYQTRSGMWLRKNVSKS